jgi:hypothetical protein
VCGTQGLQVCSFGSDLRDGLVMGALLAAYWPGEATAQLLTKLHQRATNPRHVTENQQMVVRAMQMRATGQQPGAKFGLALNHTETADAAPRNRSCACRMS